METEPTPRLEPPPGPEPLPAAGDGAVPAALPSAPRAAVVVGPIIVHSWMTPIVGLVMLALGGWVGYAFGTGSPLPFVPRPTATAAVAQATTPTADATRAAGLMEVVVARTRHFKGNPDASVTLIEFSDFQ